MDDDRSDRLVDSIIAMLDEDRDGLSDDGAYLVLAALEGDDTFTASLDGTYTPPPPVPGGAEAGAERPEPVGAFLKSVTVSGFRGIGPERSLSLHPAPGLTVVAGRNGSGKSTFAEALEVALTENSYRWRDRSAGWQRHWTNLHTARPRHIRVALAEEGAGTTTVGVEWPDATDRFDDLQCWTQRPGARRESGVDALGWADAIELYSPILSYEELGGLLTAPPSQLYDALSAILGLERVTAAQQRLDQEHKRTAGPEKQATEDRKALRRSLKDIPDERAQTAWRLIGQRHPDLAAIRALAVGAGPPTSGVLGQLRALADLDPPTPAHAGRVAEELRDAVRRVAEQAGDTADLLDRRQDLLRHALQLHDDTGEQSCPVCGSGTLDAAWHTAAAAALTAHDEQHEQLRHARRHLAERRAAARDLLRGPGLDTGAITTAGTLRRPDGVELPGLERAAAALAAWVESPDDDLGLAAHLDRHSEELQTGLRELGVQAGAAWQDRQDTWAPLATKIAGWLEHAEQAQRLAARVAVLDAAAGWLKTHSEQLRNRQLEPLAAEARRIWAALRQESNVDLKAITLPRRVGNTRQVDIAAEVDGADAGALAVMSTGELHALALALFLPRATRPESPFRFVVLDDPIQAMDPAKIDGLVTVLADLAQTRQVVVFSHDDRLPGAVRRLAPTARLLEVTRDPGSQVTVHNARDGAHRDLDDAFALCADDAVPAEVRDRVLPRLCRSAFETAARDRYFARAFSAGEERHHVEHRWNDTQTQPQRLALALDRDPNDLGRWLDAAAYRRPALRMCGAANHTPSGRDPRAALRDVERLVDELRAAR